MDELKDNNKERCASKAAKPSETHTISNSYYECTSFRKNTWFEWKFNSQIWRRISIIIIMITLGKNQLENSNFGQTFCQAFCETYY